MFELKCSCGATAVAKGESDPDTDSVSIDDDNIEWTGGNPECIHEDYVIGNEVFEEPPWISQEEIQSILDADPEMYELKPFDWDI